MKGRRFIFAKVIVAFMLHLGMTMEGDQFKRETLLVPLDSIMESDCECGKFTRKIHDERLAKVRIAGGRLPWLAELVISDGSPVDETDDFLLCFGTVVSLQTVLFPASCIQRNFYSNTGRSRPRVKLLGMDDGKDATQDISISNIRVHPGYRKRFDNDLALIKLRNRIDSNQTGIVPICLPPETRTYSGFGVYPNKKFIEMPSPGSDVVDNQLAYGDMDVANRAKKPNYVLEYSVTRIWFYRKAAGYDYIPHYGRFPIGRLNDSLCQMLFPEMLRSKVGCIQQKEVKNIVKQNEQFFRQLELGMPIMLSNTTLVRGRPQIATAKFHLEGIRAPGRNGAPLLEMRENAMALLKIEDYVRWIRETSGSGNFCKN